jgi:hypothetical protein
MKIMYLGLLMVFLLSSCGKQLNIYPHSAVSIDDVSAKDLDQLLNGVYNKVQNAPGRESYIMFDMIGGNLIQARGSGGVLPLINSVLRPEVSMISDAWNGYYNALYQVNALLQAAASLPPSAARDNALGTAHFFRGYLYYNLVTRWGDVPLLKENTTDKVKRDPAAEVWAFIESELHEAIGQLPSFSDYHYVSREAATALLARTMLAEGKMQAAASLAEQIIGSGTFQLDDFSKIFRGADNSEEIFAFSNLTAESSIAISTLFYTYAHPVKGSYVYAPSPEVMSLYDDGDNRKAISIDTYEGNNVINKYPSGQSGTDPIIVTRLAEMYLISAEAQGIKGLDRLNELRAARGLAAVHPAGDAEYLQDVYLERRRELLAEGFRWYDLVRTGRAKQELGITDAQLKLPLPAKELVVNKLLTQNNGY